MPDKPRGMLISVVIPLVCGEDDIEKSVNSVFYQREITDDYQIIIVDGCDGKESARLNHIEATMPDAVIVVIPEKNGRKCNLLNLGMEYADGKYVLFLNAGDELNRNLFKCIDILSEKGNPDIISFGMTKALRSFEYFKSEPFDEDGFSLIEFETIWQRKAFLGKEELDSRYLCNAYKIDLLRETGQCFDEDAEDDDFTFAYPLFYIADRIAVSKDHGYCSFYDYNGRRGSEGAQKRIANRFNLQLKLLELMQSVPDIYAPYQDVIEAHFFYEYFLKNLEIIEASGEKYPFSSEMLHIMKFSMLKIVPKWNENNYICAFGKKSIKRIPYLYDDNITVAQLIEELETVGMVSVIIATHNRCEFLSKSIECVLSQTWKNLELVIVDDGSDDDTERVVKSFQDDRIVYTRNECNKGISYSRNKGVAIAKGKYIVFQDDDDYCRLDKIEKQVKFLEEQPHNIGMAYCITANHCKALQGNVDALPVLIPAGKENSYPGCDGFIYPQLLPKNFVACTAMIIRKECFDTVGAFDESLFAYEDWDITLRIARDYEVGIIKEILYDYYQRNNGLASNRDPEHRIKVISSLHAIDVKYKTDMKKYGIESKFVLTERKQSL